jgi:toxin secretion/phage lysis holin
MKESILAAKLACSLIGGIIGFMFGKLDGLITALIVFVTIDYVTGFICAWAEKKLSSEVGAKGIAKKVFIFFLVAVANVIDTQILKEGSTLRTAVIFYYLANEGLSIVENAARLGLPVPPKLKDALEQLSDNDDEEVEETTGGDKDEPEG